MNEYRVKAGRHVAEDGTIHVAGLNDLVQTNRDLPSIFRNKFEFVRELPKEEVFVSNVPDPERGTSPESEYGIDVTSQFEKAKVEGLKVFAKGGWYVITDPDSDSGEPIATKLRKKAVDGAISDYIEG